MNATSDLLHELRLKRTPPPPATRVRYGWLLLAGVLLIALLASTWLIMNRPAVTGVRTAPAVAVGTANAGTPSALDASGYVVARRMATVSAKITGRVLEVLIEEGMAVAEGQIMARLDPVDAQAAYALSRSQLVAAQSNMRSLEVQLRQAESEANRLAALIGRHLVPAAQLEAAVAERDSLQAQVDTARRHAEVARRQLEIAKNGVDNTIVRAPFAGVVIAKAAQPGEIVSPMATGGHTRTGIGTIVDMESLEVEVDVSEAYIGRLQPDMAAQVVLNAYPDWTIPARVTAIIPAADRGKATVRVRVGLMLTDPRIVPNMGVRVRFLDGVPEGDTGQRTQAQGVLVPEAAIVQRNGRSAAFVVDDGRARLRPVSTGSLRNGHQHVLSGLAHGERVVLAPPDTLNDNDAVTTHDQP